MKHVKFFIIVNMLGLSGRNDTGKTKYVRGVSVPPGYWVGFNRDEGLDGY